MEPNEQSTDPHRDLTVPQTHRADNESTRQKPARYLVWAGTGMIALAAATGIVVGGTAAWSAINPGKPGDSPAPLWNPPPQNIERQAVSASPSPDDHGGRRNDTPASLTPREPGDDKGGLRKPGSSRTIEPGDDKGGLRKPGSSRTIEPGDDKGGQRKHGGSGKSSDDPVGHH
ncbi:MAG TPA: hypothetical protein VGD71_11265 [Kribbella sp.]